MSEDTREMFLSLNDANEGEVDHDKILRHLGMDFTPYQHQKSLANEALKGETIEHYVLSL